MSQNTTNFHEFYVFMTEATHSDKAAGNCCHIGGPLTIPQNSQAYLSAVVMELT